MDRKKAKKLIVNTGAVLVVFSAAHAIADVSSKNYRVFYDYYINNHSAWYYVDLVNSNRKWNKYQGRYNRRFYFIPWEDNADITGSVIMSVKGAILRQNFHINTNGRDAPADSDSSTTFGTYDISYTASPGDCFYANEFVIKPDQKMFGATVVWMYGTELRCD